MYARIQYASFRECVLSFLLLLSKQAVKALARPCVCPWADPEGGGIGGPEPRKKQITKL